MYIYIIYIYIHIYTYMSKFRDTCAKLLISYEKQDGCHHCTIDATTKGRWLLRWKQLINYQHTYMCMLIIVRVIFILLKKWYCPCANGIFANLRQEFQFSVWRLYTALYRYRVILSRSRSEADTKRNTCNNFTKSL